MISKEAENGGCFLEFLAKSAFFWFFLKVAKVIEKTDPRSLKTCKKFADPDPMICDPRSIPEL